MDVHLLTVNNPTFLSYILLRFETCLKTTVRYLLLSVNSSDLVDYSSSLFIVAI